MLKAFSSCHDNHKQWLYAISKAHCSNSNTNLILSDQIAINTLLFRKVCVKKLFHIFYCSWDSYQSLSSTSLSSSGLFVQSWTWHMSVHFKLLTIPEQDGSLQDLLHWQDDTSRTACGAGWPPIQSITSFPASVHQPDPTGDGMSGHLCKLRCRVATDHDWIQLLLFKQNSRYRSSYWCPLFPGYYNTWRM